MDEKQSKNSIRRLSDDAKKSHFRGNRHTSKQDTEFISTSAYKRKDGSDFEVAYDDSFNYSLLSFSLVFTALQSLVKCKFYDGCQQFLKKSPQGW